MRTKSMPVNRDAHENDALNVEEIIQNEPKDHQPTAEEIINLKCAE